jgi:uncharacterized membrane protein YagU involved in acid resistance
MSDKALSGVVTQLGAVLFVLSFGLIYTIGVNQWSLITMGVGFALGLVGVILMMGLDEIEASIREYPMGDIGK